MPLRVPPNVGASGSRVDGPRASGTAPDLCTVQKSFPVSAAVEKSEEAHRDRFDANDSEQNRV
ncbi:hypothetical protein, partial [Clostridium perfringens]